MELAVEKRWDESLAKDPGKLQRLVAEALEEIRTGRTKKLNGEELRGPEGAADFVGP